MEEEKKSQRREVLQRLRAQGAVGRRAQSAQLCEAIIRRLQQRRSCGGAAALLLLSYLPLPFEADTVGVMRHLWSSRTTGCVGSRPVTAMVPHVTGPLPTDMIFVQVRDDDDLARSFVPQGKFKLLQLAPEVYTEEVLAVPAKRFSCSAASQEGLRAAIEDFGAGGPVDVVVLAPATAFDRTCMRLGKGGGYYDAFLAALRGAAAASPVINTHIWGVGFDDQVIERVVGMPHDALMDEVLTPSHHFQRVAIGEQK